MMEYSNWPKKLYILDVSRGLAALGVVLWHWIHFAYVGTEAPVNFDRTVQPLYPILKLFYDNGGMGVDYFFLLSGFIFFWIYLRLIGDRATTPKEFALQRFSRLYPLHFVALLIVAGLQVIYYSLSGSTLVYSNNDIYHFLLNLVFASQWGLESGWSFNGPEWSVSIEILLYIIFFLIAYYRKGGVVTCIVISAISFAIWLAFDDAHSIFRGLASFFAGGLVFYFTSYVSAKGKIFKWPIYIATIGSWVLVLTSYYIVDLSAYILQAEIVGRVFLRTFPYFILFPLTVSSFILFEVDNGATLKRWSWIGDITYSVYLLHFPLQLVVGILVLGNFLERDFYLNPLSLVVFYIVLITISHLTFIRFERPMQRLIRQKYRKNDARLTSVPYKQSALESLRKAKHA